MINHLTETVNLRWLAEQPYQVTWEAMKTFTQQRTDASLDEIWLLSHPPVFTQGQNGKAEHILSPGDIPIVNTDRGGQVTYHGPGQLMVYTLIDLKRKQLTIRGFVNVLEQSIIDFLNAKSIQAYAKCDAPGVYIAEKKICSIGLRVRKGCTYHGIAFNVSMNLDPFLRINPCGFSQLKMTQLADFETACSLPETGQQLINYLMKRLRYTTANSLTHFNQEITIDGS